MMIVILDEREGVRQGYASCFEREGVAAIGLAPEEFAEWFGALDDDDAGAVECIVAGRGSRWHELPRQVIRRNQVPVICLMDERSLKDTLAMFAAGVDDVVAKPIHVRELLARASAIRERALRESKSIDVSGIRVFCDGRDPVVAGAVLELPRRERRILECLASSQGGWLTKSQIFRRVYGVLNEEIDDRVIESHVSRLRKRLRELLGADPIESQRFLGYRLRARSTRSDRVAADGPESFAQVGDGLI